MKKLRTDVYTAAGTLLDFIGTLPKRPVLLAIDGRCGAGKSTLARALGEKAGAAVVHMDDFFLRPEQRTPERFAEPGGNVDRERVLEEVLAPLRENRPAVYRPYDAHKPAMLEPVHLEPSPVTIIEGSYSCHPAIWNYYDARVFVDVGPEEQLRRIEARSGSEKLEAFKSRWIPLEEAYFHAFSLETSCDFSIELITEPDLLKRL